MVTGGGCRVAGREYVRDPAHGFVLTLAAGGTLTEILQDSVQIAFAASRRRKRDYRPRLDRLRHRTAAERLSRKTLRRFCQAIVNAVLAVQAYVIDTRYAHLEEIEINPLICTPTGGDGRGCPDQDRRQDQ